MRRKFTFQSRFDEIVEMFEVDGEYLWVPRAVCPAGYNDLRTEGAPIAVESVVKPKNLRQAKLIEAASELLKKGESFLIQAGTGSGKTVVACDLIARISRKTIIIVPKQDLMDHWISHLQKFLKLAPERIGRIQQDKCEVEGRDVVVGMLHSLAIPDRYPSGIVQSFGLFIADEVHRLAAETFSRVAGMFPAKLRVGLTATPIRQDGKELVFFAHIGPVKVSGMSSPLVPKIIWVPTGWKVPMRKRADQLQVIPHQHGKIGTLLKPMTRNEQRNMLILNWLIAARNKGRNVVLFSDTVGHLEILKAKLVELGIPGPEIGTYTGQVSKKTLHSALAKKIVLATYQMAGEGTDVPWWDMCILSTPRARVEQAVGRILREYPDKPQPVVIDLVDDGSYVLADYAGARRKWYKNVGAST